MPPNSPSLLAPDWALPANVRCLVTTRYGGVSRGNFGEFNLALHVDDDVAAVENNRRQLKHHGNLPSEPLWLNQVHGNVLIGRAAEEGLSPTPQTADGSYTSSAGVVCAVLTADCLPLLLCSDAGDFVAAVHCGWRGAAAGIVEHAVRNYGGSASDLRAWLGPAITAPYFEVGAEVRHGFVAADPSAAECFSAASVGKWQCSLAALVASRLRGLGVKRITLSEQCTYSGQGWYSHRREYSSKYGHCGRFASLIWIE